MSKSKHLMKLITRVEELQPFTTKTTRTGSRAEFMTRSVFNEKQKEELAMDFMEFIKEFRKRNGFKFNLTRFLRYADKLDYNEITSIVGDDEITLTNMPEIFIARLYYTQRFLKIRLSWKDIGISHNIGNYAESWILTPPCKEANWSIVNKYNRKGAFDCIIDLPKLKLLNPVRKQGQGKPLDISELHLEELGRTASWIKEDNINYDMFNQCIVFALTLFDFKKSNSFPFLGEPEGGQGLPAPFGNLATVKNALSWYKNGRCKDHLECIVEEYVEVNNLERKPIDAVGLNLNRMAMYDPMKFRQVIQVLLKYDDPISRENMYSFMRENMDEELPEEIVYKSWLFTPENALVGNALSFLRKQGRIMTELDVRLKMLSQKKVGNLLGKTPFKFVFKEEELKKKKIKRRNLKDLPRLFESGLLKHKKVPTNRDWYELWTEYYSQREGNIDSFSSLVYNDVVRVFNTEDVENYFSNEEARKLLLSTVLSKTIPLSIKGDQREPDNLDKKTRKNLEETNFIMNELSKGNIPEGIGMDDARIVSNIKNLIQEYELEKKKEGYDYLAIFLFTKDKQLIHASKRYARLNIREKDSLLCVEEIDFKILNHILAGKPVGHRWLGNRPHLKYVSELNSTYYYVIDNKMMKLLKRRYFKYIPEKKIKFSFQIDYPNFERSGYSFHMRYQDGYRNLIRDSDYKRVMSSRGIYPECMSQFEFLQESIRLKPN